MVGERNVIEWQTIPSHELEHDSQVLLYDFRASLERATNDCYRIWPNEMFDNVNDQAPSKANKPVNEILAHRIGSEIKANGVEFNTTEEYRWLAEEGIDYFKVLRSAKAETSAHGVFFGLLMSKGSESYLPVAVKPCTDKPRKALSDWMNGRIIAQSGRRHFTPVGFISDADRAYSITALETNVETYDNTVWRYALRDIESPFYSGQRGMLFKIGEALADLHENRIIHNDPQFKNIAIGIEGDAFMIDWESAYMYGKNVEHDFFAKKAAHDLEVVFFSAAASERDKGVGLLTDYHPSLMWEYFNRFILTPYIEKRLELSKDPQVFEQLGLIEELVKEYAMGEFVEKFAVHSLHKASKQK